jgi:hypothetical protein
MENGRLEALPSVHFGARGYRDGATRHTGGERRARLLALAQPRLECVRGPRVGSTAEHPAPSIGDPAFRIRVTRCCADPELLGEAGRGVDAAQSAPHEEPPQAGRCRSGRAAVRCALSASGRSARAPCRRRTPGRISTIVYRLAPERDPQIRKECEAHGGSSGGAGRDSDGNAGSPNSRSPNGWSPNSRSQVASAGACWRGGRRAGSWLPRTDSGKAPIERNRDRQRDRRTIGGTLALST